VRHPQGVGRDRQQRQAVGPRYRVSHCGPTRRMIRVSLVRAAEEESHKSRFLAGNWLSRCTVVGAPPAGQRSGAVRARPARRLRIVSVLMSAVGTTVNLHHIEHLWPADFRVQSGECLGCQHDEARASSVREDATLWRLPSCAVGGIFGSSTLYKTRGFILYDDTANHAIKSSE